MLDGRINPSTGKIIQKGVRSPFLIPSLPEFAPFLFGYLTYSRLAIIFYGAKIKKSQKKH